MKKVHILYISLVTFVAISIILAVLAFTNYNLIKKHESDIANTNLQNWHAVYTATTLFDGYTFEEYQKNDNFLHDAFYARGKINAVSNGLLPEFTKTAFLDYTYCSLLDNVCDDSLTDKEKEEYFKQFIKTNTELKELSHFIIFGEETSVTNPSRQISVLFSKSEINKEAADRVSEFCEKYSEQYTNLGGG